LPASEGSPNGGASSTSCFDTKAGNGMYQYSVEINGGSGMNWSLSFQFW
jgi:hypothetical protein